jgi:hypothetical protein
MDEVNGLEPAEVRFRPHPAGADPGDVIFRKDDLAAQASGLEVVLEVSPSPDPGPGDGIGVGAHVLEQPFLGEDLRPEHNLGIGVVITELRPDLGDEEAVGDGREDGHAVGFLEAPGGLDPLPPRFDFLDGDVDLNHFGHIPGR